MTRRPQIALILAALALSPAISGTALAAEPDGDKNAIKAVTEKPEHVSVGAFGGVGFPRPLSVEAMVRVEKRVAFGLEYSVLPKQNFYGVDATFWALAADLRVFPWLKTGFFLGLSGGYQHLGAATSHPLTGPLGITGETWFVNPRFGYLTTFESGFTLGVDVGLQIPLTATFASNLPPQLSVSQDVTNVAHFFGKSAVPTVNLLRIGFML